MPTHMEAMEDGRLVVRDGAYNDEPSALRIFGRSPDDDWRAVFYADRDMIGLPIADETYLAGPLAVDWRAGAPSPNAPADGFAARMRRTVYLSGGTYRFSVEVLGSVRLWVGAKLILDRWDERAVTDAEEVFLPAGRHLVQLDFTDPDGAANVFLDWSLQRAAPSPLLLPELLVGR